MRLSPPDDLTAAALKRLARGDGDFQRVLAWLKKSRDELDTSNRSMIDGVMLRMGQGAASFLSSFIDLAEGKEERKGVLRDTPRRDARARSDTAT